MKKLITICAVVAFMMANGVVANAIATTFWMDPADLDDMDVVYSEPAGGVITSITPTTAPDGRIAFNYYGHTGDEEGGGKVQIGYKWDPPGPDGAKSYNGKPFPDLSDYDDFTISFHNQDTEPVQVNVWINTGYTDPGWEQVGYYAENDWVEVPECTWLDLVLDFSNANLWVDQWPGGPWGVESVGEVLYRNHVTGIGISLITPAPTSVFSVDVDTVPEPATIALLGLGALSLIRRRRKA